jgi:SAM-dependent methyltransferase
MDPRQIKDFWKEQALKHGKSVTGHHSDPHLADLENWFIIEKCLKRYKPKTVLDVGCGNGQRTNLFARYTDGKVVGVDYSANMIRIAEKLANEQIQFYHGDILEEQIVKPFDRKYDCIISCRCLINLGTLGNQLRAIDRIWTLLHDGGTFVFCEGSIQGTMSLNALRARFSLDPIKAISVNLDIDETIILKHMEKKFNIVEKSRFGLYYLLTRVYYPAIIMPRDPNPESIFNRLAAELLKVVDGSSLEEYGRHICVVVSRLKSSEGEDGWK